MRSIKDIKIGMRLNLILSLVIVVLLSVFGIYSYNSQMKTYLAEADVTMREEVSDLVLFVKQQLQNSYYTEGNLIATDKEFISNIFRNKKYYNIGYPYLVAKDGTALIHPTKEGSSFASFDFFKEMLRSSEKIGRSEYVWEGENKVQYFSFIDEIDAFVSVTFYEKDLKERIQKTIVSLVVVIFLLIVVFIFVNWLISRSITDGVKKAVLFAKRISEGKLNHSLEINQKDEIGHLAVALTNMQQILKNVIGEVIEGADIITKASQDLSSSSSEQAASTEEVSSTMEQMIANIEQNSQNASQTEKIANKAANEISKGYENVNRTVSAMNEIAEKITIIEEIAEKTDLLAINAAIEAARAGEHGKGFAVVAMEVRKLAERSQIAASEINHVSKNSVLVAKETGNEMSKLVPEIQKTSTLVQEISAASFEQNTGAGQVNLSLQQLNQTNQNTAANAEELSAQAEHLREIIDFFVIEKEHKVRIKPTANKVSDIAGKKLAQDEFISEEVVAF